MPEIETVIADGDHIRKTAEDVLSRPDYRLDSVDSLSGLLEWIFDLLKPVYDFLKNLYSVSPYIFGFLLFVVAVLLVATAVVAVKKLARFLKNRRHRDFFGSENEDEMLLPETWEHRAREAFEDQDYLQSVRCLLQAGLMHLENARQGRVRRGITNREYLRRYRDSEAYDPLALMVEITDSRWYGGIACTGDDVEQCMEALSELKRITRAGDGNVHAA